jgi:hypothetical protein
MKREKRELQRKERRREGEYAK